jgi:hypothetical protein
MYPSSIKHRSREDVNYKDKKINKNREPTIGSISGLNFIIPLTIAVVDPGNPITVTNGDEIYLPSTEITPPNHRNLAKKPRRDPIL